jgi:hypothetical protein
MPSPSATPRLSARRATAPYKRVRGMVWSVVGTHFLIVASKHSDRGDLFDRRNRLGWESRLLAVRVARVRSREALRSDRHATGGGRVSGWILRHVRGAASACACGVRRRTDQQWDRRTVLTHGAERALQANLAMVTLAVQLSLPKRLSCCIHLNL